MLPRLEARPEAVSTFMRLVSEQSNAEIRRRRALDQLTPALRQLTANLMRITRGAGHPERLASEMVACLEAMQAHQEAIGYGPPSEEIRAVLDPDEAQKEFRPWAGGSDADKARWEADGSLGIEDAIREIRRASLQMTASMLVNQLTHVRKGEGDIFDAIRRLEAAREKGHAHRKAEAPKVVRGKRIKFA